MFKAKPLLLVVKWEGRCMVGTEAGDTGARACMLGNFSVLVVRRRGSCSMTRLHFRS